MPHKTTFAHSRTMVIKSNYLKQFVNLFEATLEFVGGREEFQFLKLSESKALTSCLAVIFEKLNALNKELQSSKKTLMDCKTQIFAYIVNKLNDFSIQHARQTFSTFTLLSKPTDNALQIILKHISNLVVQVNFRFSDLKLRKFPLWIVQPFLFNCASEEGLAMDCDLFNEILLLQNDDIIKPIHASKN